MKYSLQLASHMMHRLGFCEGRSLSDLRRLRRHICGVNHIVWVAHAYEELDRPARRGRFVVYGIRSLVEQGDVSPPPLALLVCNLMPLPGWGVDRVVPMPVKKASKACPSTIASGWPTKLATMPAHWRM